MPFIIIKGDITKIKADAIVNAANSELLPGGGVSGAIHDAAGPELYEECRELRPLEPGRAVVTRGYRLPAGHVIHTVGPVWRGGASGESEVLYSCYRESLALARAQGFETVAFPLISSGIYGYPPEQAYDVAQRAITDFLSGYDMTVYMVLLGKPLRGRYDALRNALADKLLGHDSRESEAASNEIPVLKKDARRILSSDVMDVCEDAQPPLRKRGIKKAAERPDRRPKAAEKIPFIPENDQKLPADVSIHEDADANVPFDNFREAGSAPFGTAAFAGRSFAAQSLAGHDINLSGLEDGFRETLLKMIDQKGLSDPECYRRANVDRKLFSKIRSTPDYHPRKDTVLAFCIALELDEANAEKLLGSAGYTLSRALKKDAIIRYFINRGLYDIYEINNALYDFDQTPLGSF